ncbi:flagellar hook-length control protein FliK [Pseudoxanthomonas dokdonensis]|uniref:flagellar hook-length control protein FliK n=1 Tax=Pseudoxanthomonas dokdonensis TaxID=344882 RepID=UPI00070D0F79|nr:flagellar hook-length control protein FliK [Pseudoxanthomonas dokdonensis]
MLASVSMGASTPVGRDGGGAAGRGEDAQGDAFSKALQASAGTTGNDDKPMPVSRGRPATEAAGDHADAANAGTCATTSPPRQQRSHDNDTDPADSEEKDAVAIAPLLPWWLPAATLPAADGLAGAATAIASALPATALTTGLDVAQLPAAAGDTGLLPSVANGSTAAPLHANVAEAGNGPAAMTTTALPALAAAIPPPVEGNGLMQGFKAMLDKLQVATDTGPATPAPFAIASGQPHGNLLPSTATVNPAQLPTPHLHSEQFGDAIGTQLSWLAEQKIGHAHIRITPHDLGPVEVQLKLDGDRVHAEFSSAQPDVRQALESSLPRLRDMLGQHGFQLTHADVGHGRHGGQAASQGSSGQRGNHRGDGSPASDATTAAIDSPRLRSNRLLDAYA